MTMAKKAATKKAEQPATNRRGKPKGNTAKRAARKQKSPEDEAVKNRQGLSWEELNRPVEKPKGAKSPEPRKGTEKENPVQEAGSDKNYGPPADADEEDIKKALKAKFPESAPQPFRERDNKPDITSESVQLRMKADYWPAKGEEGRFGSVLRAKKGELVAFHSDEALGLIRSGIAERVDDEKAGTPNQFGELKGARGPWPQPGPDVKGGQDYVKPKGKPKATKRSKDAKPTLARVMPPPSGPKSTRSASKPKGQVRSSKKSAKK
jgi:hypothetical protein